MAGTAERSSLARWLASRRYVIADRSMAPALEPGDRVLVDTGAYRRARPAVGELVALEDPAEAGRWLVKRVAAIGPGELPIGIPGLDAATEAPRLGLPDGWIYVLSDALELGRDSRRFGPVPPERLRGRVWFRFGPSHRRGTL